MKRHGTADPGPDDAHLHQANGYRKAAERDVTVKDGFNSDGTLKTTKKYLKLPFCPRSGQQLMTQNSDWQGSNHKTRPTDPFHCKGKFRWVLCVDTLKFGTKERHVKGARYYKYWELPVASAGQGENDGRDTGFSPIRAPKDDDVDEFDRQMAKLTGTGGGEETS